MKKLINAVAILATMLILSTQIATAQTFTTELADVLPDTIDMFYETSTQVDNPLETLMIEMFGNNWNFFEGSDESITLLKTILADTTLSVGVDIIKGMDPLFDDPNMYASINVSEEDFNSLLALVVVPPTEENYGGYTIYTTEIDTHIIYLGDLLIITNTSELAKGLIDNYLNSSAATLANKQLYQNTLSHDTENPFLRMYIDPAFATGEVFTGIDPMGESPFAAFGVNPEIVSAIIAEGISVSQVSDGFDIGVHIEGDRAKLEALDMMFDKYVFVPKLYDYISGTDLIMFSEQNNFKGSLKDVFTVFGQDSELITMYNDFDTVFMEATGKSFDTEILPLLSDRNAIAVHNTGQLFPAVTAIFEVSDRSAAITLLSELNQTLKAYWETLETDSGMEFYNFQIAKVGGAAFYEHKLDLAALTGSPELSALPAGSSELVFRFSIAGSNQLVISTHPDLESVYGRNASMLNTPTFADKFTPGETMENIAYINVESLSAYLETLMTTTEASEADITMMKDLLAPWHDIYMGGFAEGTANWGYGAIKVDIPALETYGQVFEDFFSRQYDFTDIPAIHMIEANFCDVKTTDWYYTYVAGLADYNIVSGYNDGCFRPNNDVTRAEFTKMVLRAAEWSGLWDSIAMSDTDTYFNDIESSDWYWSDVSQAAASGYIQGYNDGGFHPNAPITRAEAVQILYNISPILQGELTDEPFDDVQDKDWFQNAVGSAYNSQIINGTTNTTFEPGRNITRAEAAKIVYEFMFLY